MKPILPLTFALALILAACKPQAPAEPAAPTVAVPPAATTPAPPVDAAATAPATDPAAPPALAQAGFAGFGDMKLGSSLDEAKAAWGGELKGLPAGADAAACHYLLPKWAKDGNELAFMMENGKFVRYDVGSARETAPGGGKVGMTVDELQKLYAGGLQASPHKYVEGAQYLSIAASGVAPTRLVFETDAAGKVTRWRVGLSPQVDYVEGCS